MIFGYWKKKKKKKTPKLGRLCKKKKVNNMEKIHPQESSWENKDITNFCAIWN